MNAAVYAPDDKSKPIEFRMDTNKDGKTDVWIFDDDRDGKWDVSPRRRAEAARFEKYQPKS